MLTARSGRWIIIFVGPGERSGELVVRAMDEDGEEEGSPAATFPTDGAARLALRDHIAKNFARWILDVDSGRVVEP